MREPCRTALREAMVRLVVLCPGPLDGFRASRDALLPAVAGEEVHFVCDEDLSIARGVNALLGFGQIVPCFFEVRPGLSVGWTQVGRGPGNSGDDKVMRFIKERTECAWMRAEDLFKEFGRSLAVLRTFL